MSYEVRKKVFAYLADRTAPTITRDAVMKATGLDRDQVDRAVAVALGKGLMKLLKNQKICDGKNGTTRRNPTWAIGSRKKIRLLMKRVPKGQTMRDKMWKAIRIRNVFTRQEIAKLTDATPVACGDFIQMLKRNGYVRETGRVGRGLAWQLIKDTGPVRPILPEHPDKKEAQ